MNINFGDVYYEGGFDNFWSALLIAIIGALVGVLGALYIYRLTERFDINKTLERSSEEQRDALIYFYRLARGAVDHLEHLYKQIQEYAKTQQENYSHIRRLETNSNNDILRLKNIDSLLVFKSYRAFFNSNTNWIIDFKMLYNNLDTIEGLESEIKRLDNENALQMKRSGDSIKENVDRIRPIIVSITSNFFVNGIVPKERSQEFEFLIGILKQYQTLTSQAIDLDNLAEKFFQPIMKELMDKYSATGYYHELMSICQISRTQIADFLRTIGQHCVTMKELHTRFPNTIPNITASLNIIQHQLQIPN